MWRGDSTVTTGRPVKTVDWNALAASAPQNATAGKVVSQRGTHYEPDLKEAPHVFHSDIRPALKPPPNNPTARATYDEIAGKRVGRLLVLGFADVPTRVVGGSKQKARWVVRCSCGRYEHRLAAALRRALHGQSSGQGLMCRVCAKQEDLKRRYEELGARPLSEFVGAASEPPGEDIAP